MSTHGGVREGKLQASSDNNLPIWSIERPNLKCYMNGITYCDDR